MKKWRKIGEEMEKIKKRREYRRKVEGYMEKNRRGGNAEE